MLKHIGLCLLLFSSVACGKKPGAQANTSGGPAEFKRTFPDFLRRLERKDPADYYAVRVNIKKNGIKDTAWVTYVTRVQGDEYGGLLASDPKLIKDLKHMDSISFKLEDVFDWMIIRKDNTVEGSFTTQTTPATGD